MDRHNLIQKIQNKADVFKGAIKLMLALIFIALTDGLTSLQNISYIALTAH